MGTAAPIPSPVQPASGPSGASPSRAYDAVVAAAARAARKVSRVTRLGGGTSAPGLLVQRLDPGLVTRRAGALSEGVIVVSGTNGKTTTTAMISAILSAEGHRVVCNESGANLFRGVATALAMRPPDATAGVFEVDEGALERLVPMVRPRVLVLTNVFRDQLDRFGEPETVARMIRRAAGQVPEGSSVVANADDPLLWNAVADVDAIGFGVRGRDGAGLATIDGEPEICPRCGGALRYRARTIAHLGSARCAGCGWESTSPQVEVAVVGRPRLGFMPLRIGEERFVLPLGGTHNAYNAAAALAAARTFGVPTPRAIAALEDFHARFGRAEELEVEGRTVWLVLMKNPAGAGAVIDQVAAEPNVGAVVLSVNDQWADGRDISWIWDARFETLVATGVPLVAGGRRAGDVAVRLKYARAEVAAAERDPLESIRAALDVSRQDQPVVVLATYTAMLDVRRAILGSRVWTVADHLAS